jgi:hypothetical protein
VRGSIARGRLELSAEAGPMLTVLLAGGQGLQTNTGATRADPGLRAAIIVRLRATARLAPFLAVDAAVSPRSYPLVLDDGRQLGATPRLWLGASLGLALRIH